MLLTSGISKQSVGFVHKEVSNGSFILLERATWGTMGENDKVCTPSTEGSLEGTGGLR